VRYIVYDTATGTIVRSGFAADEAAASLQVDADAGEDLLLVNQATDNGHCIDDTVFKVNSGTYAYEPIDPGYAGTVPSLELIAL